MTPPEPALLAPGEALAALLATESLLLAVVGLIFSVLAAQGRRIARLPLPAGWLAACAIAVLTFVAVGASAAWWQIFGRQWPEASSARLVASALIVAITTQPLFGLVIALGLRTEK